MIQVVKANGQSEPFSEEKLIHSIRRAGIPENLEQKVLSDVTSQLYDKIPTSKVYSYILDSLTANHPYAKAKYSLKQALMMLGPTGHPFEDFVSRILAAGGYQTRVRQTIFGKCVSHEIDIVAEKDNKVAMVEAKFHNNPGTRSEIHVALYTYARFLDVKEKFHFDEAWIVTNTKTTTDATSYAECMGMKIISWSYPEGNSLRDLIEKSRLHPITILTTLSSDQKMSLLNQHVVMCKDLHSNPDPLIALHLSEEDKSRVLEELQYLCG